MKNTSGIDETHIRRRINDNLARDLAPRQPLPASISAQSSGSTLLPQQVAVSYGRMSQLKIHLIEHVLPRVNLTSYNNLRRARAITDDMRRIYSETLFSQNALQNQVRELEAAIATITKERDQGYTLLHISKTDIQEHGAQLEQLKQRVRLLRHRLRDQRELMRIALEERAWIAGERDRMAGERDQIAAQMNALALDRDQLTGERDQIAAQMNALALDRDRIAAEQVQLSEARDLLGQQVAELSVQRFVEQGSARLQSDAQALRQQQAARARLGAITAQLEDHSAMKAARDLLERYYADDQDPNRAVLFGVYEQALHDNQPYWDVRAAARAAAAVIQPQTYLEIGTRRGWSLAQVLAEVPGAQVVVVDMWVPGYGSAEGKPEAVQAIMDRVVSDAGGASPASITFLNGDSHTLLPQLFAGQALAERAIPLTFDMITVDGDHALLGGFWDLYDVFPHVSVGGAILFDDLEYEGDELHSGISVPIPTARLPLPAPMHSLRDVWHWMRDHYTNFAFVESETYRYQTGIALRLY